MMAQIFSAIASRGARTYSEVAILIGVRPVDVVCGVRWLTSIGVLELGQSTKPHRFWPHRRPTEITNRYMQQIDPIAWRSIRSVPGRQAA